MASALQWVFSWLLTLIAKIIIEFWGLVLDIAGNVFNALVDYTIVRFADTVQTFNIMGGIELVWVAFRDIANIVIIGMFVFVAISMIIGNAEFGTRRFVARVLLVAVLINFSLLFTKLFIDASHIVARQFYNGIVVVTTAPGTQPAQTTDVSGAFLDRAGLPSGFDTIEQLRNIAGGPDGSTISMVVYALTISFFMAGLAISLLYGSYLLALRAVLLIILLPASALAFASFLIPRFSEQGWSRWWEALLKNCLLAPLMMVFLWATLTMLQPRREGGTLGAFFANPGDTSTWGVLILYLFVATMLFLSMRLASSFSTSIPGFSASSGIAQSALGNLGLLAGGVGGMLGRGLIGRQAQRMYDRSRGGFMEAGGMVNRDLKARANPSERAGLLQPTKAIRQAIDRFGSQALKTATTSSFNAARLGTALSDKYKDILKKSNASFEGKGGVVAADKTKKEAQEKISKDAIKELGETMKMSEKARQEETRQLFATEKDTVKQEREKAAQQATVARDQAVKKETEIKQGMVNEIANIVKKQNELAGKAGGFYETQRENLKTEKTRLQRETEQVQARIESAHRAAEEAEKKSKDQTDIERAAYESASQKTRDKEKAQEDEAINVKFTAGEGFEREKFRSMYLKKRKDENTKKRIREAIAEDLKEEQGKNKPSTETPKENEKK